ncbi:hypothetical protein [Aureimonas mangrovi]|nr:hypothetical protein [Aureimonas mangrovi]
MENDEPIRLTEAERKAQRRRSVAIALVLAALIVIFYVVTIFRMGAS